MTDRVTMITRVHVSRVPSAEWGSTRTRRRCGPRPYVLLRGALRPLPPPLSSLLTPTLLILIKPARK